MNKKHPGSGIIVIGGHVQGLGITRIYGRLGLPVIVIDHNPYNLAKHSKYCDKFHRYPKLRLFDFLIELGASNRFFNYLILPTNDHHVEVLSRNKEKLSKYFIVGTDSWDVVEKCYNKRITYTIAEQNQIPIPKTWMPNHISELKYEEIEFPCIIKPAVMYTFYQKYKKKVFVCNTKEELQINYKEALNVVPSDEIIVQSIVSGNSEHLYSACILFNGHKAINSFVGRRARQHPPDFGNATTFAQTVELNDLLNISERLLKTIGYKGICEVEYKFDPEENEYKLLEINPRTWKWHSIAHKSEIPMLENYFNFLLDQPLKECFRIKNATFRHLVTDIPMVIKYKRKKIYKSYNRYPVEYAVWNKDDILPGLFELIYIPYNVLTR